MSSGGKQMVINTQERAVSTDINRLQSFASFDRAEFFRMGRDVVAGTDDADAGGGFFQTVTLGNPLSAVIENGFQVQPQIGSFDLFVSPGVLYTVAPIDVNPDDSPYRIVSRDLGISLTGVLEMTPNASGSTRIDVIECQPVLVTSESSNRDIFNPVTGLFSAITVPKAAEYHLTYRVWAGTAGGGWPGTRSGWLPLAVASVPTGTSSNDTITFWDVRPLAAGRLFPPYNVGKALPQICLVDCFLDTHSSAGHAFLSGNVDIEGATDFTSLASPPALYRLGGLLHPPESFGLIDLSLAQYQASGLGTGVVYVYLAEPFGLPRWAEYGTPAVSPRRPRGPKGLIVVSTTAPLEGLLSPSAPIAIPPLLGFAGTTSKASCFLITHATGGVIDGPVASNNKTQYAGDIFTHPAATLSAGATIATFPIAAGTNYPPNAKALWADFTVATFSSTPDPQQEIFSFFINDSLGNSIRFAQVQFVTYGNSVFGVEARTWNFRVPLDRGSGSKTIVMQLVSGPNTLSAASIVVVGWDL